MPGSGTLIQGTYYCQVLPIRGDAYQVEARAPGSGTLISRGRLPGPELAGWVRDAKLRDALKKNGCTYVSDLKSMEA